MLVENGRDLIDVKQKIGHGRFGNWLKDEFGWTERTAQNYMSAAQAFDELVGKSCVPEAIAFLPPTTLYKFDSLSDEDKRKIAKGVKAGSMKVIKGMRLPKATSNKTSAAASTDEDNGAAEELAKLIAGLLLAPFKMQVRNHAGFASPAFGELLQKEFARSFGAASSGGAA